MLVLLAPYCAQQSGAGSRGMILRAIQPVDRKPGEHPWLTGFLKQLRREDLSPLTARGYQSDLRLFLRWYESPALEKLTAVDLMNYRLRLASRLGTRRHRRPY